MPRAAGLDASPVHRALVVVRLGWSTTSAPNQASLEGADAKRILLRYASVATAVDLMAVQLDYEKR